MSRVLEGNTMIQDAVLKYNRQVTETERVQVGISQAKEALRHKKTISAVDFFANFVAARSDTQFSLNSEGRKAIIDGIARYPGLIHMTVNGTAVDFAAEMKKTEKERSKVTPEDRVSIT